VVAWSSGNPTWLSADAGRTWRQVDSPFEAFSSANSGVTADGHLWYSNRTLLATTTDSGATWQTIPAPEAVSDTWYVFPRVVRWDGEKDIVAAVDGRYYVTHDAGVTWARVLGPDARDVDANYSAIAFSDAQHGVMATSKGAVETTSDGGQHWSRADFGSQ